MQCCGAGAAWSQHFQGGAGADFIMAGAENRSRLFKAALASKNGKSCSCVKHHLRAIYKGKYDPIKDLH